MPLWSNEHGFCSTKNAEGAQIRAIFSLDCILFCCYVSLSKIGNNKNRQFFSHSTNNIDATNREKYGELRINDSLPVSINAQILLITRLLIFSLILASVLRLCFGVFLKIRNVFILEALYRWACASILLVNIALDLIVFTFTFDCLSLWRIVTDDVPQITCHNFSVVVFILRFCFCWLSKIYTCSRQIPIDQIHCMYH